MRNTVRSWLMIVAAAMLWTIGLGTPVLAAPIVVTPLRPAPAPAVSPAPMPVRSLAEVLGTGSAAPEQPAGGRRATEYTYEFPEGTLLDMRPWGPGLVQQ